MAKISEQALPPKIAGSLRGSIGEGLAVLGLDGTAAPQQVIKEIDAFVDAWQQGLQPEGLPVEPESLPFALGALWGEQLVRQFKWQWVWLTFHEHGNSTAPGVTSPDRAVIVCPIHFLIGCFRDAGVDVTVALSFNMLAAGKVPRMAARGYVNLMEGVRRIVPRR